LPARHDPKTGRFLKSVVVEKKSVECINCGSTNPDRFCKSLCNICYSAKHRRERAEDAFYVALRLAIRQTSEYVLRYPEKECIDCGAAHTRHGSRCQDCIYTRQLARQNKWTRDKRKNDPQVREKHRQYAADYRASGRAVEKVFPGICVGCGSVDNIFRRKYSMCEPCYYDYRYEARKPRFKEIQKNSRAKRKASGKKCINCGEPAGLLQKLMCLSCYNKKYRVENLAKCLEKERRSSLNHKDERLAANREYNQRPDVKKARNKKLRELSYFRTLQPWGWAALQEFLGYQSGEAGEF
jgi:hypothetical protein